MRFGILGSTEVRHDDGDHVAVGGPSVRCLLALLLLNAGRMVTSEKLIDGLYGENPPDGAANALQSQVSRLRRALRQRSGSDGLVEFAPSAGYRLAVDPRDVDVHRFESLAGEGRSALARGEHARSAARLREALELWRGPALADVAGAPFAEPQRVRLEELRLTTVEDRIEAELAMGRHRELVAELRGLTAAHPFRERLRAQLMLALQRGGRQAEALAVYQDVRRRLGEEFGADPSPELAAAHLAVLRAAPGPAPVLDHIPESDHVPAESVAASDQVPASDPVAASDLVPASDSVPASDHVAASDHVPASASVHRFSAPPGQFTSFVGRERELARIGALLGTTRLVTLLGPGGAGKTRLAIEASRACDTEVCFVDLVPLDDGAQVPQAVLTALGLREGGLLPSASGPRPDPTGRLVAALTERRLLLILDNCEHVLADTALLTRALLGACRELRILATSREALGITGESLRPVPPLALPTPDAAPSAALGCPAVRLFADRATAVAPDFVVDASNVETVVRICAALDGQPLAIELAAARLRSLTITEIAARLDDRFRLLSRGDRTKAPRHQTLRAVVEWSWDLLSEPEQRLARRLTVFNGGAGQEAVRAVCGIAREEADELLADLCDKSLVDGAGGRYRMLDTVRVFCAERLAEAGEAERLRDAHLAYFLDLARDAEPHLLRREQLEWLTRLSAEHGNLNAALRRAVRTDHESALRLMACLSTYWWLRGLRGECAPQAVELLEAIGFEPPAGLAEEYVFCVVNAIPSGRDLGAATERAKSITGAMKRPPERPFLILMWAMAAGPEGSDVTDISEMEHQFSSDPWSHALFRVGAGMERLFAGELAEAEADFSAGLAGFRSVGERWGMMQVQDELAKLADWRGDRETSLALAAESVEMAEQLGSMEDLADLLHRRADQLTRYGDLDAARADYERAAELDRGAGRPGAMAGVHRGLGEIARLRGDLVEARRQYELALHAGSTGMFDGAEKQGRVLMALGRIAEAQGDLGQARSRHQQALTLALRIRYMPVVADAVEALAGVTMLEGDGRRAATLLGMGRSLRGVSVPGDPDVAQVVAGARALIGTAAYEVAFERGATMPRDDILTSLDG